MFIQYFSFGLARAGSGELVQINRHDSGHVTGFTPATPKVGMGHIKTRLYYWLTLSGLAGKETIKSLVAARKAYQDLEGWSYSLDGPPPVDAAVIALGEAIHCDVYGCKPVKIFY